MSQQPYYASHGGPVIVQGTYVNQNQQGFNQEFHQGNANYASPYNHGGQQQQQQLQQQYAGFGMHQTQEVVWTKGVRQPKRCNDLLFGILFYAHLGVMAWCTATYGPTMLSELEAQYENGQRYLLRLLEGENGNQQTDDASGSEEFSFELSMNEVLLLLGISGALGFVLSSLALGFMMMFAEGLIKFTLLFNVISSLVLGLLMLALGAIPVAIMALVMFALSTCYVCSVWARIPFAAANMVTAISAVRANIGVAFFAYVSLVINFLWSFWWSFAAMATIMVTNGCNSKGECESEVNKIVLFLLFVSYYWTAQVIKNVVHVTVAGTVGTWWFDPITASSCCSRGVRDSWLRAMTFSFGSICLGSLIVAIIQAVKEILHMMRENDDTVLKCLAECFISCIEWIVEYFNTWAFTYVGLYGYSFMEAGTNVMTLFRNRGWTTIITDNLVDSTLGMVGLGVGVLTGICALLAALGLGMDLSASHFAGPLLIGFLIGLVLCMTLFSVISSAVNTVIVCFAEAPHEFHSNHRQLSDNMHAAWRQAWPNDFHN